MILMNIGTQCYLTFSLQYSTLSTVSDKEFEKEEKTNRRLSATNPRYKIKNKKICYFS